MRITTIAIFAPEPAMRLTSTFYAALLGTHSRPVHTDAGAHCSIVSRTLAIEVHPATNCPHTTMRIELTGEAEAAAKRVNDRLHAAFETTSDGDGLWSTDPGGNTVVLLNSHRKRGDAPAITRRFKRGDLVRIAPNGKVYRAIRLTRDGRVFLSADANRPEAATRVPDANMAYVPDSLIPVLG